MDFDKRTTTKINAGVAAWTRIKTSSTWKDWIAVGEAISVARSAILDKYGLTHDTGKRWNAAWAPWLAETGFDQIAKPTRSVLLKCVEHRIQIERWRKKLGEDEQARYNHPAVVWRKFTPAKPRSIRPNTVRDELVRLQEENDSLRAHLRETRGWDEDDFPEDKVETFALMLVSKEPKRALELANAVVAAVTRELAIPTAA